MEKKIKIIKADTCYGEDSVLKVAKKMGENKIRRFYVINKKNELIGVVTTVDIIHKVVAPNKDPSKILVKDIMTSKVQYVNYDENIDSALKIMNKLKTFVCPLVKNSKLIGLLSYQNLISSLVDHTRRK